MKNTIIFVLLMIPILSYSQKSDKETVYLLFDLTSKEKSKVEVEGKGYLNLNKYRKEIVNDYIHYYIGNELFTTHKINGIISTFSTEEIKNIKFSSLSYLKNRKAKTILRYNPFNKIYLIEKKSNDKIVKIEVGWIDNWTMVD